VLRNQVNPYGPSVTKEIQKGIYGHPLDASSTLDPHAFAYPAPVILLVAPLALLPFAVAAPIFCIVLYAMALSLMPLFMSCLGQTWNTTAKSIAILVLSASFPLAFALYVQQFTVFVVFAIAAGIACLDRHRPVSAGILFALSTIKPQLAVLILAWLALWCVVRWRERRRFFLSFLVSMTLLVLAPEFLVSGWVKKWLGAANLYLQYPNRKLPAAWLLPGALAPLVTAAALIPSLILLWRFRNTEPGEERFGFAVAVALAATLLIVPVWPALQYDQLLLIPAVLVMIRHRTNDLSSSKRILSMVALAAIGFSSAGALFVSISVLVFKVPPERLGHWIELPLFNFAVVPLMIPTVLVGLLWTAVAHHERYRQVAESQS
jgi:hypothetical protein